MSAAVEIARHLLIGGHLETPSEYIDNDELREVVDAAVQHGKRGSSVEDALKSTKDLFSVKQLEGSDYSEILAILSDASNGKPTAAIVTTQNETFCVAAVENDTIDQYITFSCASNSPQLVSTDNKYSVVVPPTGISSKAPFTATFLQSVVYQRHAEPSKKKIKLEKGKGEEIQVEDLDNLDDDLGEDLEEESKQEDETPKRKRTVSSRKKKK